MKTIWKYVLEIKEEQVIELPKGSEILTIQEHQEQLGVLNMWVKINTESITEKENRVICIIPTGIIIKEDKLQYICTIQMMRSESVLHIFEKKET
jgi:hypothetical protein